MHMHMCICLFKANKYEKQLITHFKKIFLLWLPMHILNKMQ